jgi:hypothetical protein
MGPGARGADGHPGLRGLRLLDAHLERVLHPDRYFIQIECALVYTEADGAAHDVAPGGDPRRVAPLLAIVRGEGRADLQAGDGTLDGGAGGVDVAADRRRTGSPSSAAADTRARGSFSDVHVLVGPSPAGALVSALSRDEDGQVTVAAAVRMVTTITARRLQSRWGRRVAYVPVFLHASSALLGGGAPRRQAGWTSSMTSTPPTSASQYLPELRK